MSLDYVSKGEAVRASTVNSIIDTLGGNQNMSPDLNVTTTARGPQVSMPSNYGGPNQKPDHILDVGRYMLSGWPMVKLELGFTLDDCLGAMKYHRADGTTSTPLSAAVVYKNSDQSPIGSDISGYALVPSDFGKDAAAHAAGWVDTMIEDPYPGGVLKAQLWKYKSGAELAEVFTNIDDQLSVQQQLSSVLQANGASEEDLSTLKIVGQWKLVESCSLSVEGQQSLVPTHEMVCKHDSIDCYEIGSFDYNVVLKASLECIDVQKDGSGEVQSTTWAWKIPLGPDADCSEGKAHSSSVTYGGNEVLFEVEEGEIGPDFSGDATYNSKAIWYGCYETEAGEEVDADDVWLNLSYDYQLKATKGAFSSSKDSGSYTQDGILSRNVFVVKTSGFTPGADISKGDKAPAEALEHGTWGVLPKDGPKLDAYCKKDSQTEFKSLDWADREGDIVSCECAQLYQFDQLETVDPLSTDHIVIRRPDDSDGAELKYISLSALEIKGMYVPPDADVEDAQTSSLQTRELDNGTLVEEMFNFHLPDTVDISLDNLSAYDIVVRNPNDGRPYVQYGKLSIDIYPDSEGDSGQKSVAWLTDQHELQLYKFNENGLTSAISTTVETNGNAERLVPDEYEFVFRKGGAAGELEYGKVQLSVHADELSGDSQVGEQKSISVENNIIQLYHMERAGKHVSSEVPTHFDEPKSILSNDYEFVVRKGGAGGEIDYTTVKLRQAKLSVDSESDDQKSIQYNPTSNELQLYKMHENGEAGHSVAITSALTSLLPADYELVVRKNGAGGEIAYTKLSAVLSGGGGIELDTQATAQQKSLEWKTQNNRTYAQLYKMDAAGEATEQVDLKFAKDSYQDLLPDDEEFVIRSAQGGEIKYKNVGVLLSAYNGGGGGGSAEISVDSEIPALQHSSLQHISQGGNDYYELYGFHDPTNTETNLAGYEYVVRHNDGNGNVSVKYLSADLPAAACPASFDYYTRPDGTHWLRGGYFQQARRFYWVSSTQITADGMIQLSVSMESTSRSGIIQGASSLPSPNVSAMYIPLWNIGQDMKPTFDYRHAPMLPRWE